jgi:hypothetical protein
VKATRTKRKKSRNKKLKKKGAAGSVAALLRCPFLRGRLTRRPKKYKNTLISDAGWPRNAQVAEKKEKNVLFADCTRRQQSRKKFRI